MRFFSAKGSRSVVGFTLIELMIAISVVAILSTIGLITYSQGQKSARDSKRKQDLREITAALELYYSDNKHYPTTSTTDGTTSWASSKADGSNWIIDRGISGTETTVALSPTYVASLPKDPVNNDTFGSSGAKGGYYYYSARSGDWGTCKVGQYYLLYTILENTNDAQNSNNSNATICGAATGATKKSIGGSNSYMIVRQ